MDNRKQEEVNVGIGAVALRTFTLLAVALLMGGCIGSRVDGSNVFTVTATLGDEENLFKAGGTDLSMSVKSHGHAPRVMLGLGVPSGVQILEGDPDFEGTLTQGEEHAVRIRVKANGPGTYVFTAFASDLSNCMDGTVVIVNLEVSGDENGATVERLGARPAPASVAAHLASSSGEVRVTATSSHEMAAEVCVTTWFTNQQKLSFEGPSEWSGQLQEGTHDVLTVKLHSPADGRYQVQATIRPNPSTGYDSVVDFLWVNTQGQSFTEA
jgi:hypothetical protein